MKKFIIPVLALIPALYVCSVLTAKAVSLPIEHQKTCSEADSLQAKGEGLYVIDKDGNATPVQLKEFDGTGISFKSSVDYSPEGERTSETRMTNNHYLKGEESENRYEGGIVFRICLEEDSPYRIDEYFAGTFHCEKGFRYIYLNQKQDSAMEPMPTGEVPEHSWDLKQIDERTYELQITGAPGQYYLLLMDREGRKYISVYDFEIL